MSVLNLIILLLLFTLSPAAVLWLCRRFPLLDKIGPVVILYFFGAFIGNLPLMGMPLFPAEMPKVQEILNNIMVPLAIPMMLFGTVLKKSGTRPQLLSMIFGLIAVIIAIVGGYLLLGRHITSPDDPMIGAKVGGMMTGTYTGGTVNMASIQKMLGVPEETFVLANTFDMFVSFCYLMFLISIGIKLFRRFLGTKGRKQSAEDEKLIADEVARQKENPYRGMLSREGISSALSSLGATILIFGISVGTALLLDKVIEGNVFMLVFILMLTTLGIACSFIKPVRNLKYSFDIGIYFIYIFSMVVASMADLTKINFADSMNILGYIIFVVFFSLLLHILFAKIFRLDSDTVVITSVTYINSPPFVPMIAAAMKNRDVLVPGLTIGIFGYAIGNYLGVLIFNLLAVL